MMEALGYNKTLVLTRTTWRNIPENGILHSHCHENHKFYILRCADLSYTFNSAGDPPSKAQVFSLGELFSATESVEHATGNTLIS
jgi:hypothetical protein